MQSDDAEIIDALQHEQKMLQIKRRRLRDREEQQAKYGINAPSEITIEIDDLRESIKHHEAELARLQTEAAVDKEPMAEVEYRMLVAEAWDTLRGRPTIAATTRLEYNRLRLGVLLDQAQQIERETRAAIAKELFREVHPKLYRTRSFMYTWPIQQDTSTNMFSEAFSIAFRSTNIQDIEITANLEYPKLNSEKDPNSMDALVKCIYLDYETTLKLYIENFTEQPLTIASVKFEPDIPDYLKEATVPFEEFIDRSKLAYKLFLDFRQQLFHSFYAARVNEEHKQIAKFIDEVYHAVTENQTTIGRYIPHKERKY